eukprot:985176-Prymnesium_polylepis.1
MYLERFKRIAPVNPLDMVHLRKPKFAKKSRRGGQPMGYIDPGTASLEDRSAVKVQKRVRGRQSRKRFLEERNMPKKIPE